MEEFARGVLLVIVGAYLGLIIGVVILVPNELENGCIVHNDNIYCEVAK